MSKRRLSTTTVRLRHRRASAYFEFLEARTLFSAVNTAQVSFSTYFGGSGDDGIDGPMALAIDAQGNKLIGGWTGSTDLPAATNSSTVGPGISENGYVAKFDPSGSLLWSTYVAGTDDLSEIEGIAIDASGNTYAAGWTDASDLTNALNSPNGGDDAFLAKISPDGDILWSLYLGGSGDDRGASVAVDGSGNAYITGQTLSTDFTGATNSSSGGEEAFVAQVDTDGNLNWTSYFGGSGDDLTGGVAVNSAGLVLIAGTTTSQDIPLATNTYHGGASDAFVAEFDNAGNQQWATYLGGSGSESLLGGNTNFHAGVAWDSDGTAAVTGFTASTNFPLAKSKPSGGGDGFVAKVDAQGTPLWSDYFGGSATDAGVSLTVDSGHNILVAGLTGLTTLANISATNSLVARFGPTGTLQWTGTFGGSKSDFFGSVALDASGNAWLAGSTSSSDLPQASNAAPGGPGSADDPAEPRDAFIAKINATSLSRPAPVAGLYGGAVFSSDFGASFGSGTFHITVGSSGSFTGARDTTVGGGQDSPGPISGKLSESANNLISVAGNASSGYATSDGNLFTPTVDQQDSFAENSLMLFVKRGTQQSDTTLADDYNTVLWGTTDGINFTSGLGTTTFDGQGTADLNISSVAQGQNSGEAFDVGENTLPYTVSSTGGFTLGDKDGGWVSADASIVVWTQTVPSADPADEGSEGGLNIAVRSSAGHTTADLHGTYHMMASLEENGDFSSGLATIVFDGQGNYSETFTNVADGVPGSSVLPTGTFNGTYTVADNGQIVLDGEVTGYLNADNSFAALAAVPGDTANLETGMAMLVRAPVLPATHLVFTQQPLASTIAGQPIISAANGSLTVSVEDAHGNIVVTDDANVTLSLQNSNSTLGGSTTVQFINGAATFTGLTLDKTGSYTLVASTSGLTSAKSTPFTITPDISQPQLAILPGSHSELVGKPIGPVVTVEETDEFGNLIATDPSMITASVASGPSNSITGTTSLPLTKGVATFKNLILPTAGDNYTLAFTSSNANITNPANLSLNVTLATSTLTAPVPKSSYTFGQTINLSATLKSNAPASVHFTGTAEILDSNNDNLGTASVAANGSIQFALNDLSAGTYTCHIAYPGDTNHTAINSKSFKLLVKKAATTVLFQPSPNPLLSGQTLTLTATVNSSSAPSVTRTGTVTFMDGSTILQTISLDQNSSASYSYVPAVGVHHYSAKYSGDADFLANSASQSVSDNLTPSGIQGDTLLLFDLAGTDDKDPPGLNLVSIAGTGNTATSDDFFDSGISPLTYTYKLVSPTTGTIVAKVNGTGAEKETVSLQLTFSTATEGGGSAHFNSGATSNGAFILYGSSLPNNAPNTVSENIITLIASAGFGALGSSGTTQFTVASDNSYTLISTVGSNINTTGSATYSLINPTFAELGLTDNTLGGGQLFLAFTSNTGGDYYIADSGNDWQFGSFTLQ